jgi:hypothetical protein
MNKHARSLAALAALLVSVVLVGCAAEGDEGDDGENVDLPALAEGELAPSRLGAGSHGYKPNVKLADLRAAGASCVGTFCTLNGKGWNCKGGGLCDQVDN